jgi:hypothetical protein
MGSLIINVTFMEFCLKKGGGDLPIHISTVFKMAFNMKKHQEHHTPPTQNYLKIDGEADHSAIVGQM